MTYTLYLHLKNEQLRPYYKQQEEQTVIELFTTEDIILHPFEKKMIDFQLTCVMLDSDWGNCVHFTVLPSSYVTFSTDLLVGQTVNKEVKDGIMTTVQYIPTDITKKEPYICRAFTPIAQLVPLGEIQPIWIRIRNDDDNEE